MTDNKIFRMPKKTAGQLLLRTNCNKNTPKASLICGLSDPSFHIRNRETPIKKYNTIQTGANIHEGGVKKGLSSILYHVSTDVLVKKLPAKPAN